MSAEVQLLTGKRRRCREAVIKLIAGYYLEFGTVLNHEGQALLARHVHAPGGGDRR